MPIDVARARADTPGCTDDRIHLNAAGSSLPPRPVLDAVVEHLELEARLGGYEAEAAAAERLDAAYPALARLLGCDRDEVAIVENATRAWDMAFYSLPFRSGDRILTATAEYESNYLAYLQVCRRTGARVEPVPDDEHGQISVDALERMLDERVRLISITHVPTNGGLVNPAEQVGAVARRAGVPFLLDACQSLGQMPLDVERIGCDMLSATGRKYLRGPRGTGVLYVRRSLAETLEPPFIDLRAAEWLDPERYRLAPGARRFENWESFVAGRAGLAVAAGYALDLGLEEIRDRVTGLAERLRGLLAAIPGVEVRDLGIERCGIVSFTVAGVAPPDVAAELARRGVHVIPSRRSSTLLDMDARGLDALVRASVHYYNTDEELERAAAAVEAVAARSGSS
ncbi:MAG TPA: aminotransferase class V-fold PLP-dependent enzyme [Gaiellales bacterium]|nr:aminotransferase class V-fold PLP-dependent enzyme [Gaiellales bacterium]